jgi:hypothetical protein
MFKKLVATSLILIFAPSIAFADRWRHHRYYRNPYPRYYGRTHTHHYVDRPGVSAGAATAIGLGVGILGFVIGRSTKSKEVIYKDQKIECKDFDIKVIIDGEEKKAKITKCRTEDGEWRIPE